MKEPIATQAEVNARRAHPRAAVESSLRRPGEFELWRSRCATCGETGYGASASKGFAALASSACLPVEKAWNDRVYGHVQP